MYSRRDYKNEVRRNPAACRVLRVYRKSVERKEVRLSNFMKIRNLGAIAEVREEIPSLRTKRGAPIKDSADSLDEARRVKLQKYREQKLVQKKLQEKSKKPVFKITRVTYPLTPFPELPSVGSKPTSSKIAQSAFKAKLNTSSKKENLPVNARVTRSRTALSFNNKLPERRPLRQTRGNVNKGIAPANIIEKPAKDEKKAAARLDDRRSFAPDNFKFEFQIKPSEPETISTISEESVNDSRLNRTFEAEEPTRDNAGEILLNRVNSGNQEHAEVMKQDEVSTEDADLPDEVVRGGGSAVKKNMKNPQLGKLSDTDSEGDSGSDMHEINRNIKKKVEDSIHESKRVESFDKATCSDDNANFNDALQTPCKPVKQLELLKKCATPSEGSPFKTPTFPEVSSVKSQKKMLRRLTNSPWITTSRGSSSSKKRRHRRLTDSQVYATIKGPLDYGCDSDLFGDVTNLDELLRSERKKNEKEDSVTGVVTPEQDEQLEPALQEPIANTATECPSGSSNVACFDQLVASQESRLTGFISEWQSIKLTSDIPEKAVDEIDVTIGMAALLMKERFNQFRTLIDDCRFKRGEKETTCEDLQGFWDMVQLQVDDLDRRFVTLTALRNNKWEEPQREKKTRKKRGKKPAAKPPQPKSNMQQFILAARMAKENIPAEPSDVDSEFVVLTPSLKKGMCTPASRRRVKKRSIAAEEVEGKDKFPTTPHPGLKRYTTPRSVRRSARLSVNFETLGTVFVEENETVERKSRNNSILSSHEKSEPKRVPIKYRTTPFCSYRDKKAAMALTFESPSEKENLQPILISPMKVVETTSRLSSDFAHMVLDTPSSVRRPLRCRPSLLPTGNEQKVITAAEDLMKFSPSPLVSAETELGRRKSSRRTSNRNSRTPNVQ